MKKSVLLIHPPIAKPGEPPAGIARLKGTLSRYNIPCQCIDANLEGQLFLLNQPVEAEDTWTKQASAKLHSHLKEMKTGSAFTSIGHYNRIVRDLNRILQLQGSQAGYRLNLADCGHQKLSTARSEDLIQCTKKPEKNPFSEYYHSTLLPKIDAIQPGVIGLSVNFLSQAFCAFTLIGLLRKQFPDVILCMGGGLVTSWMRNGNWDDPFAGLIDHCIAGPGEAFFVSLCAQKDLLPEYTPPDYSDLVSLPYLSPGFVLPYNTSSGCFWRQCSFCPERAEENPYLPIRQEQVIQDLESLIEAHHPSLIHFLDNALAPSFLKKWIDSKQNTPWYGYIRFSEEFVDPQLCSGLRSSGCVMLKLGLESGDPEVLKHMNKGIELSVVSKILTNLKEAGIAAFVYLLFGTPYETEPEAVKTLSFVKQHHNAIDYINPAIFNMPITGEEALTYVTHPFSKGDLSLYTDFSHPKGWDRSNVRYFLDRVFKRDPQIGRILRRTPKIFTSNHAPFFHS